ncbi:MAG: glycosyltransferase family 2 protein, partial [Synergistaceae bacterium]|nr:glycosyltransferase family 2 protein [Synergistaceae bacterium]
EKLVSVIVPTYNGEKHLAATLESIINQDYENLEIVLVNDVSTDNSIEIAKKILNSSSRTFQIIERSKNGGQCAARNTGLKAARGDYIIFFDHDDRAEKNFVSSLLCEAENENADLIFCGIKHFYEAKNIFEDEPITLKEKFFNPEFYLKAWAEQEMKFWSVWNFIFRKSFIDKINLHFNEQCKLGEDTEFVLKAISAAEKISFVRENLYIYVHHENMTSVKYYRDKNVFESLALSRYRSIRPVIRRVNDKKVRNYAVNFYIADSVVDILTYRAKVRDFKNFSSILKHKKIRELLFSTIKFLFKKPELFFKSLALLLMPRLYYFSRKGIKK